MVNLDHYNALFSAPYSDREFNDYNVLRLLQEICSPYSITQVATMGKLKDEKIEKNFEHIYIRNLLMLETCYTSWPCKQDHLILMAI